MTEHRRIGITVIPDDAELAKYLEELSIQNQTLCEGILIELRETVTGTLAEDQPEIFAYAKMLNFLASLSKIELNNLCAAALWKLHGQNNAEIIPLSD